MKTASSIAVAAAAGLFATSAMAADLGGNCCADLEERVAELEATAARKGNRKVSLTVYGQVNKQLLWHDDDAGYREGKLTVRDNGANMSRFGFRGEAQIRPDLKAGYVIEIGLGGEDFGVSSDDAFAIRHNYVYLDSQRLGRITLGQTSQVTDGLFFIDLANTQVTPQEMDEAGGVLSRPFAETFKGDMFDGFRRQGVYYRTPTLAGFVLSAGWSHDTQEDKDSSTSPGFSPDDADDYWEAALRYAGEFNGVRIAAGIGYREELENSTAGGADRQVWMGSASVMHTPTGLFLSGGYADRDSDDVTLRRDAHWIRGGIERNFFGIGNTTLFAEYGAVNIDRKKVGGGWEAADYHGIPFLGGHTHYDYQANSNDDVLDGSYWGLGLVQSVDAAATDLYINFRRYELDGFSGPRSDSPTNRCGVSHGGHPCFVDPVASGRDASVINAGMIIKF